MPANIAAHVYGFSFAPVATMQADLALVNQYVRAVRDGGERTGIEAMSHRMDGDKVRYTLPSGRSYSTHDDSTRLYPISGPGITHGKGPLDMAEVLRARGEVTDNQKIVLAQLHQGKEPEPIGQMNKKAKAEYIAYFDTRMT